MDVILKSGLKVIPLFNIECASRCNVIMILCFAVCHLLGDYLESIKKDFEKASKVYRSNCDDYGYSRSCLKYGNYTFLGKGKSGTKGSAAEAFKYYERGCDLKDADSCLHSGLILVSRSMSGEVKRDVAKVRIYKMFHSELIFLTKLFWPGR